MKTSRFCAAGIGCSGFQVQRICGQNEIKRASPIVSPHSVRAKTALNGATANARLDWRYDSGHLRYLERSFINASSNPAVNEADSGTLVKTTIFLGAFEEVIQGGVTTWRHVVASPDGPVALVVHKSTDTTTTTRFWHRDHLGSIVAISDTAGNLKQAFKYDPWGGRTVTFTANGEEVEERGYTGHETLAEIGLVHMNGRLYDPHIGRFLSADPIIQDMYQSQSLNRYAYVMNNPMSYTDPSGFSAWTKFRDKWLKPIIAIGVAWAIGPMGFWAANGGLIGSMMGVQIGVSAGWMISAAQFLSSIVSGFAAGGIQTGSLRGAVRGALGAAIAFGLGEAFASLAQSYQTSLSEQLAQASSQSRDALDELGRSNFIPGGGIEDGGMHPPLTETQRVSIEKFTVYGTRAKDLASQLGSSALHAIPGYTAGQQLAAGNYWMAAGFFAFDVASVALPVVMAGRLVATGAYAGVRAGSINTAGHGNQITPYYPANNGFLGKPNSAIIERGTLLDRYGAETGRYLSPAGTPLEMRALSPQAASSPLTTYRVEVAFRADVGIIAPAAGQPGLGVQVFLGPGRSVADLIKDKTLFRLGN